MAAAAALGLKQQRDTGVGSRWRFSLARTAKLLMDHGARFPTTGAAAIGGSEPGDYTPDIEKTGCGPGHRLRPPVRLADAPMAWDVSAGPLGSSPARWIR